MPVTVGFTATTSAASIATATAGSASDPSVAFVAAVAGSFYVATSSTVTPATGQLVYSGGPTVSVPVLAGQSVYAVTAAGSSTGNVTLSPPEATPVLASPVLVPEAASGNVLFKSAVTTATTAFVNGDARFHRVLLGPGTVNALVCAITGAGTAGALTRMGVYAWQGFGLPPGPLLVDAGTVDGTVSGEARTTTAPFRLIVPAGGLWVWAGAVNQGAPATPPTLRYLGITSEPTARATAITGGETLGSPQEATWSINGGATGALPASPVWTAAFNGPVVGFQYL